MEPLTLIRLDQLELHKRIDLNTTDQIRYWRTYTPKENYHFSETNRLIQNFKISPQEKHRLIHKKAAIEQIAHEFMQLIPDQVYQNFTFVPIPPSKPLNHPEYDDRLIQVLKQVQKEKNNLDFRMLITQQQSTSAAHTMPLGQRLNIQQLYELYTFNKPDPPPMQKIVIFDDVLTKGTHFKAMQKIINQHYPQVPTIGLFIALSIYAN